MSTQYIVVSGLNSSGKTTLAEALATKLNWKYIPESEIGLEYVEDLFKDMKRWAFEAQISFMTNKALNIIKHLNNKVNFVLDRSLFEDIFIFT